VGCCRLTTITSLQHTIRLLNLWSQTKISWSAAWDLDHTSTHDTRRYITTVPPTTTFYRTNSSFQFLVSEVLTTAPRIEADISRLSRVSHHQQMIVILKHGEASWEHPTPAHDISSQPSLCPRYTSCSCSVPSVQVHTRRPILQASGRYQYTPSHHSSSSA
jgi:hypothetical protein